MISFLYRHLRRGPGQNPVAAADRLRDQRDWVRAAAAYRRAVEAHPTAAHLHVQLGHALKESGNHAAAEDAYRAALRLRPQDGDISLQLGHLFNVRGDIQTACTWYAAAAELDPQNSDVVQHLANAQARLQRQVSEQLIANGLRAMQSLQFSKGAEFFREAIEGHGREDIFALLGHALKENGDFAGALAAYRRYRGYAMVHEPSMLYDVELQIGHLYKIEGKYSKALEHYIFAKKFQFLFYDGSKLEGEIKFQILCCMRLMIPALSPQ